MSESDWDGDLKTTYETGYAVALEIYDTTAGAYLPGCIVSSTATANSRRAGVTVAYEATVAAAQAANAEAKAELVTPTSLATAIATANTVLSTKGLTTATVSVPTASNIGNVEQPVVLTNAPTAAPTAANGSPSSSASSPGSSTMIIIIAGAVGGAIVIGGLVWFFFIRSSDGGGTASVKMEEMPAGAAFKKDGKWKDKHGKDVQA